MIAGNLLYAASFARCEPPAAAGQAWAEIGPAVDLFLGQLGRRLDDPDLAGRTMEMIERLIEEVCRRPAIHRAHAVGLGAA